MKNKILKLFATTSIPLIAMMGCEKKIEPIDSYKVKVEYRAGNPFSVTESKSVNPKDSIFFDFTVTSEEPMAFIEIQKNGVRIDTFRVADGKTSFSGTKGYRADSAAGDYTYRILARNINATFLGDGGKLLTITVLPDFILWSARFLFVPDTVNKTNKTYYSLNDGKIYSYTEGAAVSNTIDFGYYFDTTNMSTTSTSDDLGHTIYALTANQPQLGFYDISTWTKRATIFKKLPSSVNFTNNLTSSGAINTLVRNNMNSGTSAKIDKITTAGGHNTIGFRTVDGKYGAILFRYFSANSPSKETYVDIDVKIQK